MDIPTEVYLLMDGYSSSGLPAHALSLGTARSTSGWHTPAPPALTPAVHLPGFQPQSFYTMLSTPGFKPPAKHLKLEHQEIKFAVILE
eukprot:208659-Chlamydomonas_euryale.AAC.1